MIYAATGEEGIGNGYLPRDASGHQQAGYLRGCGGLYAYAQMHATDAGAVRYSGQPPAASLHVLCLLSDVEPCTFVAARESGGYRQYHQASDCDVCHVL